MSIGLVIGGLLFLLIPRERGAAPSDSKTKSVTHAFKVVFKNPQSILCGLIAGLLFIPTTIFDMIWGVRYLQEARGFDYAFAVMLSASVPFGWIIGCPLLGFISDRLGRRKPVIIGGAVVLLACLAWILFGRANVFPPFTIGLLTGIASGAAMLPYTVIKEANPPQLGGTATGVVNFLELHLQCLAGARLRTAPGACFWWSCNDGSSGLSGGVFADAVRCRDRDNPVLVVERNRPGSPTRHSNSQIRSRK